MMMTEGQRLRTRISDGLRRGFDASWKASAFLQVFGTLAFFFPFSLFFVAGGFLPPQLNWMSSVILILGGIATFFSELRSTSIPVAILRLAAVALVLFVVEYVGVTTGYPFGAYVYTHELGLLVAGVPVAIAVAWYCTVINTWRIAEGLTGGSKRGNRIAVSLLAGLLTLGLDIALEPMAGFIEGYWVWESGVVPVQNYASWFLLSTAAVYLLSGRKGYKDHHPDPSGFWVAVALFGFHFLLFVFTTLVHGYVLPAAIALALVSFPFALRGRSMRLLLPEVARR